ncbi:Type VI secretion system protein EvpK [Burkholderia gladioli]|uniref:type VI secretion system protein TssA n=1 Tax=Burkholderia gladioli TaxID=28095 RepID=UPI001CAD3E4F|nr:type VI secretion system protein TssA [Burkholderia gladioli]CAG9208523.1 Type VI secretion system protein EvpK [Burkholderia gladioli]
MNDTLYLEADRHFREHLHIGMEALLEPVDAQAPCGRPLRELRGYRMISEERQHDDSSLPMGAWQRDLKRADWHKVSHIAVQMLARESKDLQLLVWLFEAQLKQYGLAGVAPALTLMREMCTRHWDAIYPTSAGGDHERRANILRSISGKQLAAIRLAPLIHGEGKQVFCWADWERAHHYEKLRAQSVRGNEELEGTELQVLQAAVNAAASETLLAMQGTLSTALAALASLGQALDSCFGREAPSLAPLSALLEQVRSLFDGELHKRGITPAAASAVHAGAEVESGGETGDSAQVGLSNQAQLPEPASAPEAAGQLPSALGLPRDRADAYARLAEIAAFLMRIEPHSPAPYLVRTATEWGRLSTPELYHEVFLRLGGQLNIFEMLGIESPNADSAQ